MNKIDDEQPPQALDTMHGIINRFRVSQALAEVTKEEWIRLYRLYAGLKWSDPHITYEDAARAWDEDHGLTRQDK